MIEYFTTRNLDDDMAELAIADTFEWVQGHFLHYNGDIEYTFLAVSDDVYEDDGLTELLSVKVNEDEEYFIDIIAKKEFCPPANISSKEFLEDLYPVMIALTDFDFSIDGNTANVYLEIIDDEDSRAFLEKYFTKETINTISK